MKSASLLLITPWLKLMNIGCQCSVLFCSYSSSQDIQGLVSDTLLIYYDGLTLPPRNTLPPDLHSALLKLLLDTLHHAISPTNPYSYRSANNVVVRKLFGCVSPHASLVTSTDPSQLASILLRLRFHLFPNPLVTVLNTISFAASSAALPISAPSSGFNTPVPFAEDAGRVGWRMRLWGLEWLGICVEEVGRAGISDQKRYSWRRRMVDHS